MPPPASTARWPSGRTVIRQGDERGAVAGLDLTFSPPKSVSVLWAADDEGRELIWGAYHEGVAAAMPDVEREAGGRHGLQRRTPGRHHRPRGDRLRPPQEPGG